MEQDVAAAGQAVDDPERTGVAALRRVGNPVDARHREMAVGRLRGGLTPLLGAPTRTRR